MTLTRRISLAVLTTAALAVVAVAAPPPLIAGTYKVYSCKTPDGRSIGTDGWSTFGAAQYATLANECLAGGSMRAVLGGGSQPAGASTIGWRFDPAGARIVEYAIHRSGTATATGHGTTALLNSVRQEAGSDSGRSVDYCATYQGCAGIGNPLAGVSSINRLAQSASQLPTDVTGWSIGVGCGGFVGYSCAPLPGSPSLGSAFVHSAEFTLADDDSPQVQSVTGSLATSGTVSGEARLAFVATDVVSGIHRASIEVDGVERVSITPNEYGGRCVKLGLAGATNDFTHRRPCPASQPVELSLDTLTVPDGAHRVRVRVYDAAGNSTTVSGPHAITVANGGVGGFASARFEPNNSSRLATSFGRRKLISGRLVNAHGMPLAGERVIVFERVSRANAPRQRVTELVTDSLGRYSHGPSATAGRTIELVHEPSSASTTARLDVISRLRLRALRKRVQPHGRMVLRGRILSERGLRRVTVEIQARNASGPGSRKWRTVGIRRASTGGAFVFAYTFKRTASANLRFRARARRTSDLPVIPRVSRAVRIRVG